MPAAELLLGSQEPTHKLVPEFDHSDGHLAVEIADMVGLDLDVWQRNFIVDALGRRWIPNPLLAMPGESAIQAQADQLVSRWAATEVAIELSRQNGKSVGFEVRTLAGLFVFREKLIVYTAHKGETAMEAFRRVDDLIASDSELKAEVKQVRTGNGKEHILLHSGQMVKFRTRTAGGGRGLAGDCVILDEAQDLRDEHVGALFPVMAARSMHGDPQLWYGGSAGTKKSVILGRLVRRMLAELQRREQNVDPLDLSLMMYRWAADLDVDDPAAPETWARVNPSVGRRMTIDHIAKEYRAMNAAIDVSLFGQERLGVGDYPREDGEDWVIPRRRWEGAEDLESTATGPVVFAIEVKWDRQAAAIGVAGKRKGGGRHLEVIDHDIGTVWVIERMKHLVRKHKNLGVIIDPGSPANSLIAPLRDAGIEVTLLKTQDITQAWGAFYDGIMGDPPSYRHTGGTLLTSAVSVAQTRAVSGSTTWKRAGSEDVSPLLAVTWAAHGLDLLEKPSAPPPSPIRTSKAARPSRSDGFDASSVGF